MSDHKDNGDGDDIVTRDDISDIVERISALATEIDKPVSLMLAMVDRLAFLIANYPMIKLEEYKSQLEFCTKLLADKVRVYAAIASETEA